MRYNLSQQEEGNWCLPACLQAVLRRHEIYEEQEDIARDLGVDEDGAKIKRIEEFLKQRGFSFEDYNYNQTPFNEPNFLLNEARIRGDDVLVDIPVQKRDVKHSLLLQDIQGNELIMLDPDGVVKRTRNLYELHREMFQRKMGGFSVIKRVKEQ